MKGGLVGVGMLMLLVVVVWILQGVSILPGSAMTGDPFWAVMGLLCVGLDGFLLYRGLGRHGRS